MMKRAATTLLILLLGGVSFLTVSAQGNFTGYDMSGIPQTMYNNPALTPKAKVFVGIPLLSNIKLGYYNTAFSFDDIFLNEPGSDSLYLDLSRVANNNESINYISESTTLELISFGFKVGKSFLSFGVNTNVNVRFFYDSDLIKLAWEGNGTYLNQDIVLTQTNVFEEHFNKYYAGISVPIGDWLNVGARFNYIQGLSSAYGENRNTKLRTNVDDELGLYFTGSADFEMNTSGLTYLVSDSATLEPLDYLMNFQNSGFSVDLGVDVKINDRFSVQASVTNLGKINWNSYDKTYTSDVKDIYFDGAYYDLFNDEDEDQDPMDAYLDAWDSIFQITESEKVYSTNLRTNIFANGQYTMTNDRHRFNLLFAGRFLEESFEYSFSAGYTYNPYGKFSAKVTYTYMEHAPLNLGGGFFFNFKPFQIYMMADNIMGMFMWYDQRFLDFRFGLNILIPDHKKSDIPSEIIDR